MSYMVVAYIVVWVVLPIIEPYWVLATIHISVRGFSKLCLILDRIPWELYHVLYWDNHTVVTMSLIIKAKKKQ